MFTGIFLTLMVGILWSFSGVFYKIMAKWNLSAFNIIITANTFSFFCFSSLIITKNTFSVFTFSKQDILYSLFTFAAGFINMVGSLFLQRSMLYGKSSVTWALGQSALIVPFISISLIFREPVSILNI